MAVLSLTLLDLSFQKIHPKLSSARASLKSLRQPGQVEEEPGQDAKLRCWDVSDLQKRLSESDLRPA